MEFVTFDADYLARLRNRDAATQTHFVQYFSELIQLKLRSRVASREAIEDIRQETFARVLLMLRREDGIRQADRLGSLVNSVCNHVLHEHYRSQKKSGTTLEEEPESIFIDMRPTPLHQMESADRSRVVRQCLATLPPRDRKLLQAVLVEECDKDELCEQMGVTREYLRVLVHRAKQTFIASYGESSPSRKTGGHR